MELSAETFALFLRLESVCVSFAAAINESLAHLIVRIVVESGTITVARARIKRHVANRTLRDSLERWLRCDGDIWSCLGRWMLLALPLAGFSILEAILVTLTAAVLELGARIRSMIVEVLLDEAVAGTDNFR